MSANFQVEKENQDNMRGEITLVGIMLMTTH